MLIFLHLYIAVDCSMQRYKSQKNIFEVKRNKNSLQAITLHETNTETLDEWVKTTRRTHSYF